MTRCSLLVAADVFNEKKNVLEEKKKKKDVLSFARLFLAVLPYHSASLFSTCFFFFPDQIAKVEIANHR